MCREKEVLVFVDMEKNENSRICVIIELTKLSRIRFVCARIII